MIKNKVKTLYTIFVIQINLTRVFYLCVGHALSAWQRSFPRETRCYIMKVLIVVKL